MQLICHCFKKPSALRSETNFNVQHRIYLRIAELCSSLRKDSIFNPRFVSQVRIKVCSSSQFLNYAKDIGCLWFVLLGSPHCSNFPPYPFFKICVTLFQLRRKSPVSFLPVPPPLLPAHFIFNLFYRAPWIRLNLASSFYLQRIER